MPSSFEQIVGGVPGAEKERIFQELDDRFDDQEFKSFSGKEREKTKKELQIIDLANQATNELRGKYGLDDFDVPAWNIHVIKENEWPEHIKGDAVYAPMLQTVAAREQRSNFGFFGKTLHEMVHFKSYNSAQMTKSEDPKLEQYRVGLTVVSRDGNNIYLRNLNEAITEDIVKDLALQFSSDALFKKETRQTKDIIKRYPDAVCADGPLFTEDTYYAELLDETAWKDAVGRMLGLERSRKIGAWEFTYQRERKMLGALVAKLFERNGNKFKTKNEVAELFRSAMMTGNMLSLGKLIDGTFGAGTLRKIGELDSDIDAQEKLVETL